MTITEQPRYIVEVAPYVSGPWRVRDTQFIGPGSVFDAPVKRVVTSRAAAERIAADLERER
jgi:hypothetical protein